MASLTQPHKEPRFGWAKEVLEGALVGLVCQEEGGTDHVAVASLASFGGEAYLERTVGPRGRLSRVFDLRLELTYRAEIGGAVYEGAIEWSELSSANEPDECEVRVAFGEGGPADGSDEQAGLIALIGPLRMHVALAADGRLMQQLWKRVLQFREAFMALELMDQQSFAGGAGA